MHCHLLGSPPFLFLCLSLCIPKQFALDSSASYPGNSNSKKNHADNIGVYYFVIIMYWERIKL